MAEGGKTVVAEPKIHLGIGLGASGGEKSSSEPMALGRSFSLPRRPVAEPVVGRGRRLPGADEVELPIAAASSPEEWWRNLPEWAPGADSELPVTPGDAEPSLTPDAAPRSEAPSAPTPAPESAMGPPPDSLASALSQAMSWVRGGEGESTPEPPSATPEPSPAGGPSLSDSSRSASVQETASAAADAVESRLALRGEAREPASGTGAPPPPSSPLGRDGDVVATPGLEKATSGRGLDPVPARAVAQPPSAVVDRLRATPAAERAAHPGRPTASPSAATPTVASGAATVGPAGLPRGARRRPPAAPSPFPATSSGSSDEPFLEERLSRGARAARRPTSEARPRVAIGTLAITVGSSASVPAAAPVDAGPATAAPSRPSGAAASDPFAYRSPWADSFFD